MSTLYHYAVVRNDIPKGVQMAQILHAAGESSPGNLLSGTIAVALAAKDESELLLLENKLILAKFNEFKAIREPDRNNELMAIGFVPCFKEKIKKFISNFPLVK